MDTQKPLIVFVHVPKTAGSSINAALKCAYPSGADHVENVFNQPDFVSRCQNWDWVSGHITQPAFAAELAGLGRPLGYFACIREPMRQIISHVNWLSEILYRGERFFYNLTPGTQEIAFQAGTVDYGNPWAVCGFLLEHRTLFLNCQSRYIWGDSFRALSIDQRTEALSRFEVISDNRDLTQLATTLQIMQPPHKNVAKYRFDTSIFRSREVETFLRNHHKYDFELYEMVTSMII